jgi:hypothetical protein
VVLADANSEFELRREEERKNYDTMIGNMPAMNHQSLRDILRLEIEARALAIHTPLDTTANGGYMRVKIADLKISGLIRIQRDAKAPKEAPPTLYQLNLTDYTKPLQITTLSVNTQQLYCSISRSSQFPSGGYRNVSLMQQLNPISLGGGSAQLTVNESGKDGGPPLNIEIQAPDLFTLMRLHRYECDHYIRPLCREISQEGIFAPDPLVAWQVFSELWKPDAAISDHVKNLLPALNEDDYRARGKASYELKTLGRNGAAVLIHLDRRTLTPEQNARIDLALAPYVQLPVKEALRLRSDPVFLLDCLYSEDAALRYAALAHLRQITDPALKFDADADPDARSAAIAALRKRLVAEAKP